MQNTFVVIWCICYNTNHTVNSRLTKWGGPPYVFFFCLFVCLFVLFLFFVLLCFVLFFFLFFVLFFVFCFLVFFFFFFFFCFCFCFVLFCFVFGRSKMPKKVTIGHLSNLVYIICGHFDERCWGYHLITVGRVSRQSQRAGEGGGCNPAISKITILKNIFLVYGLESYSIC